VYLGGNIVSLAANQVTSRRPATSPRPTCRPRCKSWTAEKAKLAGDGTVNFSVKTATAAAHAVPMSQAQDGSLEFAVATGSGNALLATINPTGITVLKDGFEVRIRAPGANSNPAPTFDLTLGTTDTGAITIVRGDTGGPLQTGDIAGASHELRLQYRSTTVKWALLNPGHAASLDQQRAVAAGARRLPPRRQRHRASRSHSRRLVPGVLQPAVGRCAALLRAGRYRDGHAVQVRGGDGVYRRYDGPDGTIADAALKTWVAQGFKVSKSTTLAAVWVKIYKVGNPTNNLECRILPTTAPASRTAPRRDRQRHGDRAERQAAQLRYERAVGALRVPDAAIAHCRHAVPHHAEVQRRGRRREQLGVAWQDD
jgi:hypothetical protein